MGSRGDFADLSIGSQDARTRRGCEPSLAAGRQVPAVGGSIAVWFALVALAVASYAAYEVYNAMARLDAVGKDNVRLEATMSRVEASLSRVDGERQRLTDGYSRLETSIDERIGKVKKELDEKARTASQDWLLAEVEYLIRLANQKLLVDKEAGGAITLLSSADGLIQQAGITSAFPVRQAIAEDIARLQGAGSVDRTGIYLKLAALANQVDMLKRRPLAYHPGEALQPGLVEAPTPSAETTWREDIALMSSRLATKLGSLVDYREGVERIRPMLPPEEEEYLRLNLKLKLEIGELALLRGQQAAYEQSLRDCVHWIGEHFDEKDSTTTAMVATLNELAGEKVERELPKISRSIAEIHKYMAEFHRLAGKDVPEAAESKR